MGGVLSCYSYIGPLLIDRAGLAASAVPLVLVGFGIVALAGTTAGGRFGDTHPKATAITGAAAATAVLCAFTVLGQHPAYVVTLTILLGVSGYTVNPIVTALVVRFAASAPMLASAVTVSAFNTGIAIGSALAGLALASPIGSAGPSAVGAVIAALTVLPLAMIRTTSIQ